MTPGAGPDPASRARLLLFGGRPAQAVPLFEAAVAADSTRAEVWLLLSVARQRSGDLPGAVAAADHAQSFPATAARAQARLGILTASQGKLDEAFAVLGALKRARTYDLTRLAFDPDAGPLLKDARWRGLLPDSAAYDDPFVESVRILGEWRGEAPGGQFGWIARNVGDLDGDGRADFAASAPTDSRRAENGGSVDAYSSVTGELLWRVSGDEGAQLGLGLEAAGDVDGDGVPDVLAAEPPLDRVLVLSGRDGAELLRLEPEGADEAFGTQVSDLGDVNGDGHADLLIGAPQSDAGGEDAGRLYVMSGTDGAVLWSAVGEAPGSGSAARSPERSRTDTPGCSGGPTRPPRGPAAPTCGRTSETRPRSSSSPIPRARTWRNVRVGSR